MFFRVFAVLCQRLRRAKELQLDNGQVIWRPFNIIPEDKEEVNLNDNDKFGFLCTDIRKLLTSEIDNTKFEDDIRELFGIHSYLLFTLDRLLDFLCRKLQSILCGDECMKLIGLWQYEQKRNGANSLCEPGYLSNAREIVGAEKLIRLSLEDSPSSNVVPPSSSNVSPSSSNISGPPKPPSDMHSSLLITLLPSPSQVNIS